MGVQRERLPDTPVEEKVGSVTRPVPAQMAGAKAAEAKPAEAPKAAAKPAEAAKPATVKKEAPKPKVRRERPAKVAKAAKAEPAVNDGAMRVLSARLGDTLKYVKAMGGLTNARTMLTMVEEIATTPLE